MNAEPARFEPGSAPGLRRAVTLLASGSTAAFLIGYVSKIVLLRLYSPADFGIFEIVIAVAATLLPIASLRYEDAMVLPDDPAEARDLFVLSALLSALFVGLVGVAALILLFNPSLVPTWVPPDAVPWILTIPVVLLVLRASKILELWLTRRERYGRLAAGSVTQASVMTVVRIAGGLARTGPAGLLGGFVVGHAAAATLLGTVASGDLRRQPGRATWAGLRRVASIHRRFALWSTPASLVAALVTRLPYFLLLVFFTTEIVGLFGQAFNILYVPLSLVAGSIGQVFFPRAARAVPGAQLGALASNVHERLVLLALFPVLVTAAAAPDVFEVFFSSAWRPAGEYAGWLAGWILLTAIGSPLTRLFDVLRKQTVDLVITLVLLAATTAALVLGGLSGDVRSTLLLLGTLGAAARAVQIVCALRLSGVAFSAIVRPYLLFGLPAIPAILTLRFVMSAGSPMVTTAVYGLIMIVFLAFALHRERGAGLTPSDA